jgi:hypothetical protein
MEKAVQCTNCGIISNKETKICECCEGTGLIDIVLAQEDDYVFADEEDPYLDEEPIILD